MQNPGQAHWEAVKRVINYLEGTKELWLTFRGKGRVELEGYCDSDWASQPHHHSISGFSFHYRQGTVSWSSKKQGIITLLSTEAKYVAESHARKPFVREIMGWPIDPLTIKADNQGAIVLVKDNKFHARTIHINLHYHFVHEAVEDGKIKMEYIPTLENVMDIFTKALAKPKFLEFVGMLGLVIMKEWRASTSLFQDKQGRPYLELSCD